VTALTEIFSKGDRTVSIPFIHALAPRILEYLFELNTNEIGSELELELIVQSLICVQTLVHILDSSEKRKEMVNKGTGENCCKMRFGEILNPYGI